MERMFRKNIDRIQLFLTLLVWILILAIPLLFGDFENGINWDHVFSIWIDYCFLLGIFLLNRFILMPFLFFKEKRAVYFLSIFTLIAIFSVGMIIMRGDFQGPQPMDRPLPPRGEHMIGEPPPGELPPGERLIGEPPSGDPMMGDYPRGPAGKPGPRGGPKDFIPPYANLIIMSILLIGFDSGLMFFSKWMQSEQNKISAEKESIKNKMAFLQNQVSPHFFMNTLNNIHALIDIDTEEAKDSVIKLSNMMNYMLYESQSSTIPLKQEMEFIQSYVELMKLRFTDKVEVKLEIPETVPLVWIPPLLTISFIENAFKYGISYESPSFIHIQFDIVESGLSFRVANSVHNKREKKENSGIGIDNACKRLKLIYGDNYYLSIEDEANEFEVKLSIPV